MVYTCHQNDQVQEDDASHEAETTAASVIAGDSETCQSSDNDSIVEYPDGYQEELEESNGEVCCEGGGTKGGGRVRPGRAMLDQKYGPEIINDAILIIILIIIN